MKKNIVYWLGPICGVALFLVFYYPFSTNYDKAQAQKQHEDFLARQAKAEEEAEKLKQESEEANRRAAERKAEREAKEARKKADEDALQAADDARRKAHNDKQKYEDQVTELRKEIKVEEDGVKTVERQIDDAQKEQDFLQNYVQQAEVNRKNILSVLDKITAVERAKAEDAAKKAAAAKDNS